jgi:hypothetical protein
MKIAVECCSPLLQKSLEMFLEKYISTSKKSDIIIRDEVCMDDARCFYISTDEDADLVKPFSKSQLILALEKKYNELYPKSKKIQDDQEDDEEQIDFSILEKRIEYLTQEYQANILRAVKAFYEK